MKVFLFFGLCVYFASIKTVLILFFFPWLQVLLMTIQNAPPGLDYDRDKKFSKVLVFFLGVFLMLF